MKPIEACFPPGRAYFCIERTESFIGELVGSIEMELRFELEAKSLRKS